MSESRPPNRLVSESQLFGWRHRLREIEEVMSSLEAEYEKLESLIHMAEHLEREAGLLEAASVSGQSSTVPIKQALDVISPTDKFPKAVALIVERAEDGVTYDELREAILTSALGSKLRRSDKGFYHALARAKARGDFVEHRGFVFTPKNLDAFRRKVAAGLKRDKPQSDASGSPLMDALLEVIALNPGIVAKEAIEMVRAGSEKHRLAPLKNEGSAYNAVARLKQREEVEAFGHQNRQLRIGPKASEQFKRMARPLAVQAKMNTAASQ